VGSTHNVMTTFILVSVSFGFAGTYRMVTFNELSWSCSLLCNFIDKFFPESHFEQILKTSKYGLLLCRDFTKWTLIAGSLQMRDFYEVGGSFCEESIAESLLHIPSNSNRLQMVLLDPAWMRRSLNLKGRLRC
jgi:hypothetical protein